MQNQKWTSMIYKDNLSYITLLLDNRSCNLISSRHLIRSDFFFFFVKYKKLALLSLGQIQNLVKKVLYEGHGACLVYNLHGKKFSLSWTASWGPNSHSPVICQNGNSKYKIATRLSVQTMYIHCTYSVYWCISAQNSLDENALRGLLLTSVLSGAAP